MKLTRILTIINLTLYLFVHQVRQEEIFLVDDLIKQWKPDVLQSETKIITCDRGYKILINVIKFWVDGASGDYLLIKSGLTASDSNPGKILTYNLKSNRSYTINSNEAYLEFKKFGPNPNPEETFTILIQRIGEAEVTTTPSTGTTIDLPTAIPDVPTDITVYVGGKYYSEYQQQETQKNFRKVVGHMADDYAILQNMEPTETISDKNVLLKGIKRCPSDWPDSDYCVAVTMAVPIYVNSDLGYQLNESHLIQMWDTKSDFLLEQGMQSYVKPNSEKATTLWIVISGIVLVGFFVALLIVRFIITKTYSSVKRKNSDAKGFADEDQNRTSLMSLGPDPLQSIPPIFERLVHFDIVEPGTPNAILSNNNNFTSSNNFASENVTPFSFTNGGRRNPGLDMDGDDLDVDENAFQGGKFSFDNENEEFEL